MSDFARIAANLCWALGAERTIALGTGSVADLAASGGRPLACADTPSALREVEDLPVERREWDPGAAAPPFAAAELERALIVCDGLLERVADPAALVGSIRELLAGAQAALVSIRDRDLDGQSEGAPGAAPERGWNANELAALLAEHGLPPVWMGLGDGRGEVGRRTEVACALAGTAGERVGEALAAGGLGLRFDRAAPPAEAGAGTRARVCIASYELVGPTRSGGIGTAYTSLAEALAEAGHEVTLLFTGWPDPGGPPFGHWVARYRERGIELARLPPGLEAEVETGHPQARRSYAVYRWLRERDRERPFDVIHFPETVGHGYYTALARRQGLGFARSTIAIGTHSSTSWVLETNGHLCQSQHDHADDFIERETVRLADAVISPSAYMLEWMRAHGWQLPPRCFVQQYVQSGAVDGQATDDSTDTSNAPRDGQGLETELVFFGRLETRKGLELFCDALDLLCERRGDLPLRVTFLGKQATIDGRPAGEFVAERARSWPWQHTLIDDLTQPEAIAYLRAPGRRLAVMPSLADNSPNTVYEALALRIPFIASRVGGTAELIDPRDVGRATFDPGGEGASGARDLAQHLDAAIASERLRPPRPALDPELNRNAHLRWHEAIAAALRRGAGEGGQAGEPSAAAPAEPVTRSEDGGAIAACVLPGGGDAEATRASIEAQTRPATILDAGDLGEDALSGSAPRLPEWALIVAAGVELEPEALAVLSRAAASADAEIVAATVAVAGDRKLRVPVGGPPIAALLYRCLGDLACLVRTRTLAEIGGIRAGLAADQCAHELLFRALLAGRAIQPVPEPVATIPAGQLPRTDLAIIWQQTPWLLEQVAGPGAAKAVPPEEIAKVAQQVWAILGIREWELTTLYENRFGRLTKPLRWIRDRIRRTKAMVRRRGSV